MHALIPFLLLASSAAAGERAPARVTAVTPVVRAAAPRVEVAFVLDTTGSMGGLIDGAKRKIWSIARRIGEGRPRPDLRIALVGYRDLGDEYVTRVHDFSRDMDEVHERLMAPPCRSSFSWGTPRPISTTRTGTTTRATRRPPAPAGSRSRPCSAGAI